MAKAKQKKTAAKGKKPAVKKVAAKVKSAAKSLKKKVVPKKAAKPAPKKPVAKKPAPKPVKKAAASVKKAAKAVTKAVAKVAKPVKAAVSKAAVKTPAKATVKPVPKAVVPPKGKAPVATPPPPPAARPAAAEEKKRGRRARPRVQSSGAPAAAWLSTEKPRPASFIPAPPRAEAPSAIAAPPASSDRLLRPEDIAAQPAVRTVPVRIDVEQGPGRFYVIASPMEVTLRVGEGIEWDFRYIAGADVTVDEIIIEFERPSPFSQSTFKTRKPGGARPHRQMSGPALPASAGKRIQYTVRAMNAFKTEVARTNSVWMNVTA